MKQKTNSNASIGTKGVEIGVALIVLALGALVIYDSARLGAKWADDGPQAGYFPFYIGVMLCVASAVNLVRALLLKPAKASVFVEYGQLKLVMKVLIPTAVYAGVISTLGLYLASTVFIAFFMRWLGRYPWWKVALVSIGNSVFFFLVFEMWFRIPLPKGPLEAALGLN